MSPTTSIYAYSAVTLSYGTFAPLLVLRGARSWLNVLFVLAATATAIWAGSTVFADLGVWPGWTADLAGAVRDGLWFTVVLAIIYPEARNQTIWRVLAAVTAAIVLVHAYFTGAEVDAGVVFGIRLDSNATGIATIVIGFILLDNMLRNLSSDQFWSAKYLGIGLLCVLTFQLLVRVPEFLTHTESEGLAAARPLVFLLVLPLFVVTTIRSPALQLRAHSSRKFVFRTAAIIGMGVLLEGTAIAAYFVRVYGGDNATVLSIVLGVAGVMGAAIAISSASLRSRLRTFINENFFSYKYDYRLEWAKFIRSLSSSDEGGVALKALRTLAEVVDSPGGALWILRQNWRQFVPIADWSMRTELAPISLDDSCLAEFSDPDCIFLDLEKADSSPSTRAWHERFPAAWLVVPLRYRAGLMGVALINKPRAQRTLNWEDENLINLVAQQLAAFLVQEETAQALADARQLKDFNKRFAFIIHDVKNTVGQLKLLVRNVEQFGSDPEFRKDMILTLRHSVEKLQELLAQLKGEPLEGKAMPVQRVDIGTLISRIVAEKRMLGLDVVLSECATPVFAEISDKEALLRVLEHVVTNAIEAAPEGSTVNVGIGASNDSIRVTVDDKGPGMTQEFIANELFRPLRTTKDKGFGIGAYQAREIMHDLGGDIEVRSKVNKGTTITLVLPLTRATVEGTPA